MQRPLGKINRILRNSQYWYRLFQHLGIPTLTPIQIQHLTLTPIITMTTDITTASTPSPCICLWFTPSWRAAPIGHYPWRGPKLILLSFPTNKKCSILEVSTTVPSNLLKFKRVRILKLFLIPILKEARPSAQLFHPIMSINVLFLEENLCVIKN